MSCQGNLHPHDFHWVQYIKLNEDLSYIKSEREAIYHYVVYGIDEGRRYNINHFDWSQYIKLNEDLQHMNEEEAISHYVCHGIKENRIKENRIKDKEAFKYICSNYIPGDFDWKEYTQIHKDLHLMNEREAISHYINHGVNENRKYKYVNEKEEFRCICSNYIPYIRNITLPLFQKNSLYEAVLIEYRILPHLEVLIRNTILKLGEKWSHTIICGNLNYHYMLQLCNNISPTIKVVKTNYDNLYPSDYNSFLSSLDFWNLLNGEKILIYQEDSIIFKSNIEDFLCFDYIGAPWHEHQNDNKMGVGNGGISLRSKRIMVQIINKISIHETIYNSDTLNYIKNSKLLIGPEDVYFSKNMENLGIGKLADRVSASNFSTESILNTNSFAGHNFWICDPNWRNRVYNNFIQFKSNYNFSFLQHRGGWKTILENLIECGFYNNSSNIEFFDMMEMFFLWRKDFRCKNKWAGILHCTQNTPDYLNIVNISFLFDNNNFIESLDNCLFIITLGSNVTNYLLDKFKEINVNIPIYTLKHPVVVEDIILFDYDTYINNNNKKIIQLGQQLRKVTTIYLLPEKLNFEKYWLTGTKDFNHCQYLLDREIQYLNIDRNLLNNNVNMYYTKTFEEYDELLSKNIVLVNLFDAAANNSVLECIVRNTPIIINKLDAVVEYLGENYPLYFNEIEEIPDLLNNNKKIFEAYEYLSRLDKHDLTIEYFTKQLFNILVN